ncbi:MAG: hypothetical protein ACTSQX_15045 [Candidatus Heimdallarchaeota archaeon]
MKLISSPHNNEDNSLSDKKSLRELTNDIIFCPVCGGKNDFTQLSHERLNYFCAYCHRRLNDYWEEVQQEKSPLLPCHICEELTFGYQQHCISCGAVLVTRLKRPGETTKENKVVNLEKDKKGKIVIIGLLIPAAILIIIPALAILITSAEFGTFWWEFLVVSFIVVLPILICSIGIIFFFMRVVSVRRAPKENINVKLMQK